MINDLRWLGLARRTRLTTLHNSLNFQKRYTTHNTKIIILSFLILLDKIRLLGYIVSYLISAGHVHAFLPPATAHAALARALGAATRATAPRAASGLAAPAEMRAAGASTLRRGGMPREAG